MKCRIFHSFFVRRPHLQSTQLLANRVLPQYLGRRDTFGANPVVIVGYVGYGPLTNCAIAASVFAVVCLVIDFIFHHVDSNIIGLPSYYLERRLSPEKRVSIGAMTAKPSSFRNIAQTNAGRD